MFENESNLSDTPSQIQIYGHRGGFAPENSLSSFEQAISNNLNGIEFDVSQRNSSCMIL